MKILIACSLAIITQIAFAKMGYVFEEGCTPGVDCGSGISLPNLLLGIILFITVPLVLFGLLPRILNGFFGGDTSALLVFMVLIGGPVAFGFAITFFPREHTGTATITIAILIMIAFSLFSKKKK
jgi:hypothetical protein